MAVHQYCLRFTHSHRNEAFIGLEGKYGQMGTLYVDDGQETNYFKM